MSDIYQQEFSSVLVFRSIMRLLVAQNVNKYAGQFTLWSVHELQSR